MRYDIENPQQQLLIQKMIPQVNVPCQQDYGLQFHVDRMHTLSLSIVSIVVKGAYSLAQYDRTRSSTYPNHSGINSRLRILVDWRSFLSWHILRILPSALVIQCGLTHNILDSYSDPT